MLEATRVDRAEGVVFQSAEVDHNGTLGCVYPVSGLTSSVLDVSQDVDSLTALLPRRRRPSGRIHRI